MSEDRKAPTRLGGATRINDTPIGFGLKMFVFKGYGREERLWVWSVNELCSGPARAKIVGVTLSDLRKMRSTIDGQINLVTEWEEFDNPPREAETDD
jgi:hypothetical protein